MTPVVGATGDDAEIVRMIGARRGSPVTATSVERSPSPFATLSTAEVVSVTLHPAERVSLFVKEIAESDHPDKTRRDREVIVYQTLLADGWPRLPVPGYYGVRVGGRGGVPRLVLELVDGWDLRYHALEHWVTAARELARLHAWFAARPEVLRACGALLRINASYLRAWAVRAREAVAVRSPRLALRLRPVVDGYGPPAALLAGQPHTLVHNDLAPKNVMADRSRTPARICFVDWEMAAVGCGVLDLVHLRYGLEPDAARELEDVYAAGVATPALVPHDAGERRALLAACELHKTMYRLAHTAIWRSPLETVERWVDDARAMWMRVAA